MQYLVFVGSLVSLVLLFPYIKETIKGNTKPNRITWLLWSVSNFIAFFAAISKGVGLSAFPIFIFGFAAFSVFLVSFVNKKSYWKLGKFDYFCGFFSILAIVLWVITKEANMAILFSILADFFATIPTFKKSWYYPETENVKAYVGGLFSSITGLVAVKFWNFSEIAFLIYIVISNAVLIFLILRKKFKNYNN